MSACRRLLHSAFKSRVKPVRTELYPLCRDDKNYTGITLCTERKVLCTIWMNKTQLSLLWAQINIACIKLHIDVTVNSIFWCSQIDLFLLEIIQKYFKTLFNYMLSNYLWSILKYYIINIWKNKIKICILSTLQKDINIRKTFNII